MIAKTENVVPMAIFREVYKGDQKMIILENTGNKYILTKVFKRIPIEIFFGFVLDALALIFRTYVL